MHPSRLTATSQYGAAPEETHDASYSKSMAWREGLRPIYQGLAVCTAGHVVVAASLAADKDAKDKTAALKGFGATVCLKSEVSLLLTKHIFFYQWLLVASVLGAHTAMDKTKDQLGWAAAGASAVLGSTLLLKGFKMVRLPPVESTQSDALRRTRRSSSRGRRRRRDAPLRLKDAALRF